MVSARLLQTSTSKRRQRRNSAKVATLHGELRCRRGRRKSFIWKRNNEWQLRNKPAPSRVSECPVGIRNPRGTRNENQNRTAYHRDACNGVRGCFRSGKLSTGRRPWRARSSHSDDAAPDANTGDSEPGQEREPGVPEFRHQAGKIDRCCFRISSLERSGELMHVMRFDLLSPTGHG